MDGLLTSLQNAWQLVTANIVWIAIVVGTGIVVASTVAMIRAFFTPNSPTLRLMRIVARVGWESMPRILPFPLSIPFEVLRRVLEEGAQTQNRASLRSELEQTEEQERSLREQARLAQQLETALKDALAQLQTAQNPGAQVSVESVEGNKLADELTMRMRLELEKEGRKAFWLNFVQGLAFFRLGVAAALVISLIR